MSDRERIDQLRRELELMECELHALRGQLREIHTSDAWAILRTISQLRHALAPHGTRRDRLVKRGVRGLRRLKKGVVSLSEPHRTLLPSVRRIRPGRLCIDTPAEGRYAVICLPMIEWPFRFQRPQQLMRQFAAEGPPGPLCSRTGSIAAERPGCTASNQRD